MTLRIITLASDSPLAENGVEDGDYISQVNGTEISTRDELRLIYKEPAVEFKIQRGSKKFTVQLSTDEPGATVEDGEGEFFALLPQSTLRNIAAAPQKANVRLAGESQSQSTKFVLHEESDAEKAIMFVAWAFLFINVIGGIFLIAQFGSEAVLGSEAKVWNIELIAVIAVACLSSVFLVAFAAILCHYKRHLASIEKLLLKLTDK